MIYSSKGHKLSMLVLQDKVFEEELSYAMRRPFLPDIVYISPLWRRVLQHSVCFDSLQGRRL